MINLHLVIRSFVYVTKYLDLKRDCHEMNSFGFLVLHLHGSGNITSVLSKLYLFPLVNDTAGFQVCWFQK